MVDNSRVKQLEEKIKEAHSIKMRHEDRIRKAEIDNIIKQRGW